MKHKVILVASKKMDANKKPDRNEGGLIRMPAKTRKAINFNDDVLTVSKKDEHVSLKVFQAFSADIKDIKDSGKYTQEELCRIAFVTSDTFRKLTGKTKGVENVWLSDDIESTVLGADPEFLLFDGDGNVVRANSIGTLEYYGAMGYDGAMAEIRPKPSDDPEQLVKNMHSIFAKYAHQVLDNYIACCACYHKDNVRDYPVGGHIHIGNPRQLLKVPFNKRINLLKVLNKILDEFLAIPMIKLDGKIGAIRRTKCQMAPNNGYGYFGEYRTSGSGNNRRLENRTLSGMWLLNPAIAKAVVGCAKVIVDEVFNKVYEHSLSEDYFGCDLIESAGQRIWREGFTGWKDIQLCKDMHCTRSSTKIVKALTASDPSMISKPFMKDWKRAMRSFDGYAKYRDYVDAFHSIMLLSRKELKKWPTELKTNWIQGKKFIVDI